MASGLRPGLAEMEHVPDVGGPQGAEVLAELRRDEVGARKDGEVVAVCEGCGRVEVREQQVVPDRGNGYARLKVGALAGRLAGEGRVYRLAGESRQDEAGTVGGYLATEAIRHCLPLAVVQHWQTEARSGHTRDAA
jgi:hypothetical protein